MKLKLGDVFFKYDVNLRVYQDPETGVRSPSPLFKYSFRKWYYLGETAKSKVFALSQNEKIDPKSKTQKKVPKGMKPSDHGFLTETEKDDQVWRELNHHRLSEEIRHCKNIATLKQIAELLKQSE